MVDVDVNLLDEYGISRRAYESQIAAMVVLLDAALGQFSLSDLYQVDTLAFCVMTLFLSATYIMLFVSSRQPIHTQDVHAHTHTHTHTHMHMHMHMHTHTHTCTHTHTHTHMHMHI
jgi:hypothetical protein